MRVVEIEMGGNDVDHGEDRADNVEEDDAERYEFKQGSLKWQGAHLLQAMRSIAKASGDEMIRSCLINVVFPDSLKIASDEG